MAGFGAMDRLEAELSKPVREVSGNMPAETKAPRVETVVPVGIA